MCLDFRDGLELLNKAIQNRNDELLFQRWTLHYERSMSFAEFKDVITKPKPAKKQQSKEDILKNVYGIIDGFNKGVGR